MRLCALHNEYSNYSKKGKLKRNKISGQRLRTSNLFSPETEHAHVRHVITGYKYFQINNEKGNYFYLC